MSFVQLLPNRTISPEDRCFFIAEIGQNHQGNLKTALSMIDAAKKSCLPEKFSKFTLERPYINEHSWGRTYGEHKEHLEFSEEEFRKLKSHADNIGISFSASPKDIPSLEFLIELGVPFLKIGSGDAEDFLLLRRAVKCGLPLVISTGMLELDSVTRVHDFVKSYHHNFVLLHCVSCYPTKPVDVNLGLIKLYQHMFPSINIGYSGHEEGISISISAATLGAKIIERHLTLDKNQKGNDHRSSLLPEEFKSMVDGVRTIEQALITGQKCILECEKLCYSKLGKCLVAAKKLFPGSELNENCIKIKVGYPKGILPKDYDKFSSKKINRIIEPDESILEEDLTN